jgi:hypothetical protein
MQISQSGLSQVGPGGITVYPVVFIHRSAIPKRVFLGNYGGHTFLGIMKSWPVLSQFILFKKYFKSNNILDTQVQANPEPF